ncbi:helix-turn-helix transcriptional regulator [Cohnella sp. JJ-181]|uniref:helix-turn-helix transcriptional regulator n=1 Tax=Cohnella rhizoplanae TaxID=2974897 RepID=UPI0022FF661D|nr:AraC family transcriptional regulator [Cohnella sp. JJ-181]CAI6079218.1 HTH-type transcriptional activator RhaS [Cohnella sp. JJ-181]
MHPPELRENTYLSDGAYPVNLFRNVCPAGPVGRSALYLHWHDHFEWIYMVSGRAIFHIDSQPHEAEPGDLLLVPSGGLHVGYALDEGTVEYWSLVFNRSLLQGLSVDPLHDRYLSAYVEGRQRFPVRFGADEAACETMRRIVREIGEEYAEKSRAYELVVKSKLYQMFALAARFRMPEREGEQADRSGRRMERFKSLILHIEAHYADKLTIEAAAKLVSLNPYHFCKVFKNATGRTFVEFVNQHRMNVADRLLREGELTVTEVGERVGIDNPNYFTKLFRQFRGMTPSEAKKGRGGERDG